MTISNLCSWQIWDLNLDVVNYSTNLNSTTLIGNLFSMCSSVRSLFFILASTNVRQTNNFLRSCEIFMRNNSHECFHANTFAVMFLRIMRMFSHEFFHMKFSRKKFCSSTQLRGLIAGLGFLASFSFWLMTVLIQIAIHWSEF